MCDYSLQSVKSRPAKIADNLTVRDFGTGTATDRARVLFEMGELKGVELERCLVSWPDDLEPRSHRPYSADHPPHSRGSVAIKGSLFGVG